MAETRRLLSDEACEQLARDILAPFVAMNLCSDNAIKSVAAIIGLRIDMAQMDRDLETVEAKIQTHGFLAGVIKGLPS